MHDVLATTELEEELKIPEKICSYHSNGAGGWAKWETNQCSLGLSECDST